MAPEEGPFLFRMKADGEKKLALAVPRQQKQEVQNLSGRVSMASTGGSQ